MILYLELEDAEDDKMQHIKKCYESVARNGRIINDEIIKLKITCIKSFSEQRQLG